MLKRFPTSFFIKQAFGNTIQSSLLNDEVIAKDLLASIGLVRICSFGLFLINSIINIYTGFAFSAIISITSTIIIGITFLIKLKYCKVSRFIITFTFCCSLTTLSYVEGIATGSFVYLLVLLIVIIFMYSYHEKIALSTLLVLITVSLLIITFYAPQHNYLQNISKKLESYTLITTIFCALAITFLIAYVLLKRNFENSRKLVQKQQFLNTVYNTSLDAVFIVNEDTLTINDCNEQSLQIFDFVHKSFVIGKPIKTLFHSTDNNKLEFILNSNKRTWQGELTCSIASGSNFVGYVSVVPFLYVDTYYKKISILDITEIKKAEAALVVAKEKAELAMNAKSQFLSDMSHELRTPLNGIIGTANLLLDEACMPEQKEYFNLLKYSSEHMLSLVNDVLDFSKIEAQKLKLEKISFNVHNFLHEIKSLFSKQFEAKGIALEFDIDTKLNNYFFGDKTRLSQVLSNLTSNALKFTEKGKVIVAAKIIKASSKKASIYFSIIDTGLGITKTQSEIIFMSFMQGGTTTTRKFGGTGLGLSISKNIIEMYNGELKVESKKGEGSNFYFTIDLDIHLHNKNFVNEKIMPTLDSFENMRILVAEDNQINMLVTRKLLKKWNVIPMEAFNGIEAMRIFNTHEFDVLLIDLEMPEMDGYEVIKEIRKTNKFIPIIAFTAAVYDNMKTDLLKQGFTDCIQKPFRPEDLHKKIASYAKPKRLSLIAI